MSKKLSKSDLAYNACIDVCNEQKAILDEALDTYNRAAEALNKLVRLGSSQPQPLNLMEKPSK